MRKLFCGLTKYDEEYFKYNPNLVLRQTAFVSGLGLKSVGEALLTIMWREG